MGMSKKYKWMSFTFQQTDIIPENPEKKLSQYIKRWGWSGSVPEEVIKNSVLLMREQMAKRVSYDYNAHIQFDLNHGECKMYIPQIDFTDTKASDSYVLDKRGIVLSKDSEAQSKQELSDYLAHVLKDYSDVALLYSAGGIADSCDI
jgi:hypothetical protein